MPEDETAPSTKGSKNFTVQPPGTESPTDQFVYEPVEGGAWTVYPPGVPCETGIYRISRATPAGPDDFAEMQAALDEEQGEPESTPEEEVSEDELPPVE
jgi:hypothetical protein